VTDDELSWRRLSSRTGQELPLFDVRLDEMEHPKSGDVLSRLVLSSVDWVNMVALTPAGESVMVRQFRFGVGYPTLETPGGMVDPGEDSLTAARRELLEETGYSGGTWRYLGAVEPNPAIHDHLCHHWLAEGVEQTQAPANTDGEHIQVALMSEAEVRVAVQDGILRHALALSALARVFDLWPRPFTQAGAQAEMARRDPVESEPPATGPR
jgi:8-oxo-dGTP pyrophosphatase MutT (NUDIX family)